MSLRQDKRERMTEGGAPARASDRACGAAFATALAVIGSVLWLAGANTLSAWLFVISGALLIVAFLTPGALSTLNALRARILDSVTTPPIYYVFRRILAIIWWNTLFLFAGLLLVGLTGEAWLRFRAPFTEKVVDIRRVAPDTWPTFIPDAEMRFTNKLDYWVIARTNSLGFLDREPPAPDIAAANCHIVAIGDSFVEAVHVGVEDKFHVRLEEMAAAESPDLDVATSAFGISFTGQTHQLGLYDHYARPLHPNVVVLVFVSNDFADNSPALYALRTGYAPDGIPYVTAARNADGTVGLRPVSDDVAARLSPVDGKVPQPIRIWGDARSRSLFAQWLWKRFNLGDKEAREKILARAEELVLIPGYDGALDGWEPADIRDAHFTGFFMTPAPPPVFQEALALTAFALDEFVNRTERDGAELVILASHTMGHSGDPLFERMTEMAAERGIPVINQSDYVTRQGRKIKDARFALDDHWNEQGHQWAAEALLDWLRENPEVCVDAA